MGDVISQLVTKRILLKQPFGLKPGFPVWLRHLARNGRDDLGMGRRAELPTLHGEWPGSAVLLHSSLWSTEKQFIPRSLTSLSGKYLTLFRAGIFKITYVGKDANLILLRSLTKVGDGLVGEFEAVGMNGTAVEKAEPGDNEARARVTRIVE